MATSFLSVDEFAELNWGKAKHTKVDEQNAIRKALMQGKYYGEKGYEQFAKDFYKGNLYKAYQVASSLLSADDFSSLNWGKLKRTNVNEQDDIRQALKLEKYKDEKGYDAFARDFYNGNSQKAYQVASSLLSADDFASLNWGKLKRTNVNEQDQYREALKLEKYKDEKGYDEFAIDYFNGNSQKAYRVASSLLGKDEFSKLNWGKLKVTNVKDQSRFRAILKSRQYRGKKGYEKFATDHFQGSLHKAYLVASSLLSKDDFTTLKWGMCQHITVDEQKEIREAIKLKKYWGPHGYKRFALDYFQGRLYKTYRVTKAVLSSADFDALNWGPIQTGRVELIRRS